MMNEDQITQQEEFVDYSDKGLKELLDIFQTLLEGDDVQKLCKEAEVLKACFYKNLRKEKIAAGYQAPVVDATGGLESGVESPAEAETEPAEAAEDTVSVNPFAEVERGFKELYGRYRAIRAKNAAELEKKREENYAVKQGLIEELKTLLDAKEDLKDTFPAFRDIQNRWRAAGPVPQGKVKDLYDTYQHYVELFYDYVKINKEFRDLDFKKNLEAKEKFCEQAEELAASENVVDAFKELQKLHEQWKELGPVAKEFRESIWERFKAATAVINRKYQAYFEEQKGKQVENLAAKAALCEKVEAIADKAEILTSNEWNSLSKEIEDIQKEWRTIGFATRKENQKIYDRFRAACDKFFERKRVFYSDFKNNMNENLEKKMALIEEAEKLKSSTDWKKTTELFIELQKKWKEIGAVPRKKSEVIWKRFRAACDEYFAERDKNAKPENDFYGNLKAKKALVDEIKAFVRSDDEQVNSGAYQSHMANWNAIGFVPFKEKDSINQAFREAMQEKFPDMSRGGRRERPQAGRGRGQKAPMSEKDRLVQQYNKLQQEIETYENNIGFFAESKNAAPLIRQMQDKIEGAKEELKSLEQKIREIEDAQEQ